MNQIGGTEMYAQPWIDYLLRLGSRSLYSKLPNVSKYNWKVNFGTAECNYIGGPTSNKRTRLEGPIIVSTEDKGEICVFISPWKFEVSIAVTFIPSSPEYGKRVEE
jgi:hypothetical protein